MGRKKVYAKIRVESFENRIAFYNAQGRHLEGSAIRAFADSQLIDLDEVEIQRWFELYSEQFELMNDRDSLDQVLDNQAAARQ